MKTTFHILNGDTLKKIFPKALEGSLGICRECFVEGPTNASNLKDFFQKRAFYLKQQYGDQVKMNYNLEVATLFYQLNEIPVGTEINLWFEDDLFCQVNLWFCLFLLHKKGHRGTVYLVRPQQLTPFGFGDLSEQELLKCFKNRRILTKVNLWAKLWKYYQTNDLKNLKKSAQALQNKFPFVSEAVCAHNKRNPSKDSLGLPKETLKQIILDLKTQDFKSLYKEFSLRIPIYGFGDLLVKRLYDELLEHSKDQS